MLYDPKWETKKADTVEPWREVLLRAAELIQVRGHAKYALENKQGNLCVVGALCLAATGNSYSHNAASTDALIRMDAACNGDVLKFNNAPDRTIGEVIVALRNCAALSRARACS